MRFRLIRYETNIFWDGVTVMPMALIVHGGSGNIEDARVEPHRRGVEIAAQAGWKILLQGGSALDAVEATIVVMEDDPAFDAGVGSYLNQNGDVEMDASFMDGRTLDAGAVAGVRRVKNVIRLARRVMASPHTFLISHGAEIFAQEIGMELIDNDELKTQEMIQEWNRCIANPPPQPSAQYVPPHGDTVGCVAVDGNGNIAAGTSTGGMNFKRVGRVGDSPIIGAGVYADNLLGGASATGWGESIMRVVLSKFAIDSLEGDREPVQAARAAIKMLAQRVGGTGGIIIADRLGRIGFSFNTPRMAYAFVTEGKSEIVACC
jgi:beta-aspartyl-peptidase (threonine type)